MSNDKFFSKENIYPSIWTIIIALLSFIGALFWKSFSGPDEVIVIKKNNDKDTTITVIQFKPDQEYFDKLTKLTTKSVKKQYSNNKTDEKKKNIDLLTLDIAKQYQLKFDSLRLTLSQSTNPITNDKIVSLPTNYESNVNVSSINRPRFKMPNVVEGYFESKINSYASITLNGVGFARKERISANIDFFNKSTLDKITPIFVELVEPKSANSVYQIWSEQYKINDLKNILSFSADFKPGKYILTIGFYLKDEINTKYPTFYARKVNIEIK